MIRKTTVIVASRDVDTQWRRIRKSAELRAELRAEHCAEHPAERRINHCILLNFQISLLWSLKNLKKK